MKKTTSTIWDVLSPEQRRLILKLKDKLAAEEKRS